uniref:PDZ domain-containing protein n=1 Tax=Gopherus agassizii TaxID=38772 RepID=A0A452H4V0_9SAUR
MSKTLRKKRHWLSKVQECAVSWGPPQPGGAPDPDLLRGGAELGEFPYLGARLLLGELGGPGPVLLSGKPPSPGDVLLEVNGTPVSGLTHRDTLAVIRHFREPVRLKTVRPGESATPLGPGLIYMRDEIFFCSFSLNYSQMY